MLSNSLKKLVLRKDLDLVTEVIQAIDTQLCVQDSEGAYLLGNQGSHHPADTAQHKAAVTLEGEGTIGWVVGSDKAPIAARLLSRLAYRELEKRAITQDLLSKYKEITLLFKLSESVLEILDIQGIAQLILHEAQQLVPSCAGSVLLLRETTQTLEPVATYHSTPPEKQTAPELETGPTEQPTIKLGEGIIGKIAATKRGEIVNHVLSDDRYSANTDQQCRTLICIPLKIKDRLIGVITLHRLPLRPYRSEDFKRLVTLGTYTASIISMMMHEKQLQESRQNKLIYELSSRIRDSLELSITLETAVRRIRSALSSDRCFFLWHRQQPSESEASSNSSDQTTLGYLEIVSEAKDPALQAMTGSYSAEELGHKLLSQLRSQQIVQINDVNQLSHTPLRIFLLGYSCEALLAFPMSTGAGQLGLLCCCSNRPRDWNSEETKLLQAVSNQLIVAIDQAELYERSQIAAQLAEDKAQALEAALDKVHRMQAQLIHTEKMSSIGRMVAGVAHEINNPVNFIHGNLDHLQSGIVDMLKLLNCYQRTYPEATAELKVLAKEVDFDFLQDDLPKLLDSMVTGTSRIEKIVLSLRNFSQLDQAAYKAVDLQEGLNSTLLLLNRRFHKDGSATPVALVKHYGNLPQVECYAKQINQVFISLLSNALESLESSTVATPTITITTAEENGWAVIRIADNGPGIPEAVMPYIFDPFFTTKDVGEGTGLGLSMSYQIVVDEHKGQLEYCPVASGGSEFVVKIPITLSDQHHAECSHTKPNLDITVPERETTKERRLMTPSF